MILNTWTIAIAGLGAVACILFWLKRNGKPDTEPRTADPASQRRIAQGELVGYADKHDTHAWLGIPYAQPPVGALRWKAPRPPLPWQGVRQALEYGPVAVQFAGPTMDAPESEWGQVTGSEDCLTLSVFAPRFNRDQIPAADKRLPVMVWIHGGANTSGTSAPYQMARNLAGKDGVIIVMVNYRLGILGWFSLEELHEAGDTPEDRSGNFGTLDLIAALKWVRESISAFGGDPGNVTIFGESAGGHNVFSLMASPLAKGLFHKAIAQSPLVASATLAQGRNFADDAEPGHEISSRELLCTWLVRDGVAKDRADAKAAIVQMGAKEIAAYLRSMPPAELLSAITPRALGFYPAPLVFRDGTVIPDAPMLELFGDRERYNAVPVIIGTNRDEYKLFLSQNPEYVNMVLGKIPVIKDADRYNRDAGYMSELWKARCVDEPAARMVASGNPHVWAYRFDWDEQPPVPVIQPRVLLGAAHVLEIGFIMRDLEGEFDPFRSYTAKNLPGRKEVSDAMAGYWVHFARSGDPGCGLDGSHPEWRPWSPDRQRRKLMVFDTVSDGGTRMVSDEASIEAIKRRLAADPSFDGNPGERCTLYGRMFIWSIFADATGAEELARFAGGACANCRPEDLKPAHWP